jgi:hypothetical protein
MGFRRVRNGRRRDDPAPPPADAPPILDGWTASAWADRLASRYESTNPELAVELRGNAATIRAALRGNQ